MLRSLHGSTLRSFASTKSPRSIALLRRISRISCSRRPTRRSPKSAIRAVASKEALDVVSKKSVGEVLDESYDKIFTENEHVRRVGIVLHPTSLPGLSSLTRQLLLASLGPYGCGEVGREALRFIDWLESCACQCWQVLPLGPPDQMFYSPYTALDTNCGNPLLISIDSLIEEGLLQQHEAPEHIPMGHANFKLAAERKEPLLKLAAGRLLDEQRFHYLRDEMWKFRSENVWIEDSALFEVLRSTPELMSKVWWQWPEPIRFRTPEAMQGSREQHQRAIDEFVAIQFLFNRQWSAVKQYANDKGIKIIGDMPIYVGGHSADVWANQRLFELSDSGAPAFVSGVPPDAFSKTGQLWGTPLYHWAVHRESNYEWWAQRLGRAFQLFDETRIDHFRGFAGYYSVEAHRETAMVGQWKKGPGRELFDALRQQLGPIIDHGIIAEDLGVITPDVYQLREEIEAPGMVVLQFAFGSNSSNIHLPHLHNKNSVVYPGTLQWPFYQIRIADVQGRMTIRRPLDGFRTTVNRKNENI